MADARVLQDLHDDVLSLSRSANYRWRMSYVLRSWLLFPESHRSFRLESVSSHVSKF